MMIERAEIRIIGHESQINLAESLINDITNKLTCQTILMSTDNLKLFFKNRNSGINTLEKKTSLIFLKF